jgi:hypothetical protein
MELDDIFTECALCKTWYTNLSDTFGQKLCRNCKRAFEAGREFALMQIHEDQIENEELK